MARLLGSYVTCVSPLASPTCKLSPAAKARVRAAHRIGRAVPRVRRQRGLGA